MALGLVALMLVPVSARTPQDVSAASLRIEWSEFRTLHDAGKVVVVDVRAAEAYEAGHIPGARSVPLDRIESRAEELRKLGRPLVLYCA